MRDFVKRIPVTLNGRSSTYTARSGNKYKITKHTNKAVFYLWKIAEGGYEKISEEENPYELYELIDKLEGL